MRVDHPTRLALIGLPYSRMAAPKVPSRNCCHSTPVAGTPAAVVSIVMAIAAIVSSPVSAIVVAAVIVT